MAAEMRRVGVIGGGTMGVGIAITAVRAGHEVLLRDIEEGAVEQGVAGVRRFLDRSVDKGKLAAAERDAALGRLRGVVSLEELRGCDVVIEAVPEDLALKQELLAQLDGVLADDALVHTNTSTLSVTAIASGSRRPERVVGTHYCNPAPLMDLVELVRGQVTSAAALAATRAYVEGIGKRVVACADVPGFIVNRFLVPFENDCIRALECGMGTIDSIDRAVKDGLGYPMGTFRLLDIIGLDIHRAVSLSLYDQLRDPRFAPPPLVDRMISAGHLGRKAGRGFYAYDEPGLHGS
ncbi:3-hydroxyacyl-CoA dehydrogenase family protein [Conexibacter woesei]|uniref:3-hydroxybutyryl-CoA dehydrogenase n=1 Tax=Conexibacter woesei (strain DSM 14684 / CCUG 47730 / CIP 108061 / JCM 11494 / NBRC 100937 / ID131577) TaxID=469383 RepID=D3F6I8_CONWI|nr:3-hydroxyacyl-CoA dehydrogenase family protein [Conexibacter woesei]ADB50755.1 3-hydroxybutyryl-CoA dehydrogenase [Conexibacter woesei DSM 14684]